MPDAVARWVLPESLLRDEEYVFPVLDELTFA